MERRDVILENIKKLELLLQAIFKHITLEDHAKLESRSTALLFESISLELYNDNPLYFIQWLEGNDANNTDNLLLLIQILQQMIFREPQHTTVFENKINLIKNYIQQKSAVYCF